MLARDSYDERQRMKENQGSFGDSLDDLISRWTFENTFNRIANTNEKNGTGAGGGLPLKLPTGPAVQSGIPGASTGAKGFLSKFLGGIDPTSLILGGLSLFGNSDPYQKKQGYNGALTSPENSLGDTLSAIQSLAGQISAQSGQNHVPQSAGPVSIPGIPFQIGGALGTDPAMIAPLKLQNPFGNQATPAQPGIARRRPNGNSSESV